MLNNCVIIGRLTRDPELRYTAGDAIPVATFSLAVERSYKNKAGEKEVDFINIVAWNKLAEHVTNYLTKGSMCAVVGRLQIRSYEDREGVKRKVAEIVAENVRFLSINRKEDTESEETQVAPEEVEDDDL